MNAKRFIIGLILMVMPIVSMADGKLSKDPLPGKICSFLTTHFPDVKVAFYKIEKNGNINTLLTSIIYNI